MGTIGVDMGKKGNKWIHKVWIHKVSKKRHARYCAVTTDVVEKMEELGLRMIRIGTK